MQILHKTINLFSNRKASPLSKLKRIARVFSSTPQKKIKGETQGFAVPLPRKKGNMEIEQAEESFEIEPEPEPEKKPEQNKPKEKKAYQPLIVGKNIYLTGKDGMRKQERDVEGWDDPEEGDLDDVKEVIIFYYKK